MTNLVLLGLSVLFSLTLAGNVHFHISLPGTIDGIDSLADFGYNEPKKNRKPKEPKEPNQPQEPEEPEEPNGMEPKWYESGM